MAVNPKEVAAGVLLGVIIFINILVVYEFIRRYRFYKEKQSPLFYCYVFVVLGGIVLIVDGIGQVLETHIQVCFELALAFLFTSYSLPVYSWVLIIFQVNFMVAKWEKTIKYTYIAVNLAIYASACVSGLFPNAVYYLIFVISFFISVGYLISFWVLRTYFSNVTSRLLSVLSRIANRVVGVHSIVLVVYIVLAMPYSQHTKDLIETNKPYLIKAEIIAEVVMLMYNLHRMSTAPSPSPSKNQIDSATVTATHPDSFSPESLPLDTDDIEMTESPALVSITNTDTPGVDAILTNNKEPISYGISSRKLTHSSSEINIRFSAIEKETERETDNFITPLPTTQSSPPNRDPTTNFDSYSLHSTTNLGTSNQTSQVFTNISVFGASLTHPRLDSSGLSVVFPSSVPSSTRTSQCLSSPSSSNLSIAQITSDPRTAISTLSTKPSLTTRTSLTTSSLSFNSHFHTNSGTSLVLPVHTPSSLSPNASARF